MGRAVTNLPAFRLSRLMPPGEKATSIVEVGGFGTGGSSTTPSSPPLLPHLEVQFAVFLGVELALVLQTMCETDSMLVDDLDAGGEMLKLE
mmetsp:Transcript_58748/g.165770  ORF Transcript_58748/g.165770 Transcript_58748/m.165770 type:complete len:91 (+) Transcript_58748:284-556(+)